MHRTKVRVAEDALDANATIAQANRGDFDRAGVKVINLMSAPGAGKTTLLERVLGEGLGDVRVGVLEGDVQGSLDADRLSVELPPRSWNVVRLAGPGTPRSRGALTLVASGTGSADLLQGELAARGVVRHRLRVLAIETGEAEPVVRQVERGENAADGQVAQ